MDDCGYFDRDLGGEEEEGEGEGEEEGGEGEDEEEEEEEVGDYPIVQGDGDAPGDLGYEQTDQLEDEGVSLEETPQEYAPPTSSVMVEPAEQLGVAPSAGVTQAMLR